MALIIAERDTPDTPSAGSSVLYPKSDGKWYFKDDAGVEHPLADALTSETAVATTSGTSHDFLDIPSWVKRITIMVTGMSTNGSSVPVVQIGDSGGIEATDYVAVSDTTNHTVGFGLDAAGAGSGAVRDAVLHLVLVDASSNTWLCEGACARVSATVRVVGRKSLSGTLDRVRLTTVNGTDTFDLGSVNIMYE
jgi:hypothetical protein